MSKKLKLKAEDANETIKIYDEKMKTDKNITISDLYKKQKEAFESWWNYKHNEFTNKKCIVYTRNPKSKKQKLKYIAKLNYKEYEIFKEEVSKKIEEVTAAIPERYRYAFEIEKDIEYINTSVASITVTDEYTRRLKEANKHQIKAYLSKCYQFKHKDMQKTFEDVILKEKLNVLDESYLYDMKEITAKRIMLNYFDEEQEKSKQKKVVDVAFVPVNAKMYKEPPKKRLQRKEKREGFEEVELLNRTFFFFKKELKEDVAAE